MNKQGLHMMVRTWIWPILGSIGLVFALWSVWNHPVEAVSDPVMSPPRSPFPDRIVGIGVVEPQSEMIRIGVQRPGLVQSVVATVGQTVRQGDVLLVLDSREADAEWAVLQKSVAVARVHANDAEAQFERVKRLRTLDPRAVSEELYSQRQFAYQKAQAAYEEIRARCDQADTIRSLLTIRAPMDGTILSVNVRPGEYAPAGVLAEPMMRMGQLNPLHIRVEMDQENAGRIVANAPAYAIPRGATDRQYALRYVRTEPYIRPKQNVEVAGQRVDTRVLQVVYAITEPPPHMWVGQQMDVFIEAAPTPVAPGTVAEAAPGTKPPAAT